MQLKFFEIQVLLIVGQNHLKIFVKYTSTLTITKQLVENFGLDHDN